MYLLINQLRKDIFSKVSLYSLFTFNNYLSNESCIHSFFDNTFFDLSLYFKNKGRLISRYLINFKLQYFPPDIFIPTYYDFYFLNSIGQTPFVITIHDMIHELFLFDDVYSKKIIEQKRKLILNSKAIIAISHNTKKDILSIYPEVSEEKISVVYWGNPMSQYKKFHFANKKKKQLLFVGKRDGYKNFNWLINSVYDWLIINDFFLLCVGGNSFSKEELSEQAFLSIDDRVMQKNLNDQDLVYAYSESFALIVPSLYEGFCFPIVEAMSLNCPVVYANNSCLPEIAAKAGVSFTQNDKNEFNNCLNQLLNNTEFYNSRIEAGLIQANNYKWSKCAIDTIKVYEKCLK